MLSKTVKIGDRIIGDGFPAFIVVELGVCHEKNVDLAKHFIEIGKKAGADAVKVESFQADELVVDRTIKHRYGSYDGDVTENYYTLLKRLELSYEEHAELKKHADDCGILFFSTVHNQYSADFMESVGVCAFKIASPDVINGPLLCSVAKKGKPVFLDTGGAFLYEVEKAVLKLEEEGCNDVLVMHNPSGYPAPPEKTDLRIIPTLKQVFQIPVGLSCHTPGLDVVMASIALGANIIEKPISRNKRLKSPEHIYSFLDTEANDFVRRIRNLEISLGMSHRTQVDEKSLSRFIGRRGIYASRDITPGEPITEDNILLAKPARGISVSLIEEVLGCEVKRFIPKHSPLTWKDI